MLKYVQVSPYRSSSALGGTRRADCCDESPTLSSPSTPTTRLSSVSSHAYTCSSASSSSSSGAGPSRGVGRADSVSLNSSMSCSSLSQDPLSSRSSSSTSLHDGHKVGSGKKGRKNVCCWEGQVGERAGSHLFLLLSPSFPPRLTMERTDTS